MGSCFNGVTAGLARTACGINTEKSSEYMDSHAHRLN